MQAGRLRHRVTLQQLVTGSPQKTPMGAPDTAWADVATVYASVEPLRGAELFRAQQINAETTGKMQLRYRSGVTTAMRVSFRGRRYNILAVINPEELNEELMLYTSEGLNQG